MGTILGFSTARGAEWGERIAPGSRTADYAALFRPANYELCGAGDFVWRPGGNIHIAHAPDGATFISVFNRPNWFFDGTKFFTAAGEGR